MRTLAVVVAVALLSTLVLAGNLWLKVSDERTQAAQLQARVAGLESAPPPSPGPPVPAPAPIPSPAPVKAPAPVHPVKPAAAVPNPVAQAPAPPDKSMASQVKQLMSSSAGNDMMRMSLQQEYPDLAKELGLPQEQADKLLDMLVRQQMDVSQDEMGLLSGQVTDPHAVQAIQSKVEDKRRAAEAELYTLLGSKYTDWQKYQATAAARQQVTRLQSTLGSDNALSDKQSKALVEVLAEAQSEVNAEQRNEPELQGSNRQEMLENQLKQIDRSNQRMFDAASPILTFPQQQTYKRMQDQTSTMQRSLMNMLVEPDTSGATH